VSTIQEIEATIPRLPRGKPLVESPITAVRVWLVSQSKK
jgi:hypothetical protein